MMILFHIHQNAVRFIMRVKNMPLYILLNPKDDKFLQAKLCSVTTPLSICPGMFANWTSESEGAKIHM